MTTKTILDLLLHGALANDVRIHTLKFDPNEDPSSLDEQIAEIIEQAGAEHRATCLACSAKYAAAQKAAAARAEAAAAAGEVGTASYDGEALQGTLKGMQRDRVVIGSILYVGDTPVPESFVAKGKEDEYDMRVERLTMDPIYSRLQKAGLLPALSIRPVFAD